MRMFWRQNSDTIGKFFIYQFGITVFGFLLYNAAIMSGNKLLEIVFSVFSILFYLFLIYTVIWDIGSRDKIKIDGGRMKREPLKGVYIGLFANIPNFLFAFLSTLGYLFIDKSIVNESSFYTNPEWAVNLFGIFQIIGIYANSMYAGLIDYFSLSAYPYTLFIIMIPLVVVSGAGYNLGIMERLGKFSGTTSNK